MNKYKNPIIMGDYSDPDVIRVGSDFYMVASSFNHTPGIPILHSLNLCEWELINYVFDEIPFSRFKDVCHGDGAWAPSIRYHDGTYYCMIPFPDEGIYVSHTKDIRGKWSKLHKLIEGKGYEDPCPIWINGKTYVALAFAKSRMGFNSVIGVCEVNSTLTEVIEPFRIVYDGHNDNPTIEGPKFNVHNDYIYILAPAGSVKSGWQVALRSKNIYGPYESKVVLTQGDTLINGPHQGALVDIDDNDNYRFIHFQDMRAYGRIVHLEPVCWHNDWPILGKCTDPLLTGTPVLEDYYPIDIVTNYKIETSDDFKDKLSLMWQNPANQDRSIYEINNYLRINSISSDDINIDKLPSMLLSKIMYLNFKIDVKIEIDKKNLDEIGVTIMGNIYSYLSLKEESGKVYLYLKRGEFNGKEETIIKEEYLSDSIEISIIGLNSNIYDCNYYYLVNNKKLDYMFKAFAGRWIGAKCGIFKRGSKLLGHKILYFKQNNFK